MSSTANRVIKNTGYLYAKMGITMFISLYTTRLILNSLGASDFGIFNIVGGAIAMLGFLNAAMAGATQRFMSYAEGEGNKEKQTRIFNISVVLHLLISLLVGVVLLIAGYFFFNGILNIPDDRIFAAKVIYGSLIVSTMFTVMTVPYDAVMNAHENMKYYAIVGIIESVLKLAVAFIVVYTLSDKLIVYGVLMACIPLITMVIMRVYCHKHYVECVLAPKRYWHKGLMKEMSGFAGWNLLGSAAGLIGNYGNGILINHFFGVILNAAIGVVNQLQGQLTVLTSNMQKALTPVIVKKEGEGQREEMVQWSYVGCRFSFLLLAWIAIPIGIEAEQILRIWLKNVPEWTVLFLRLSIIRALFELTTVSLSTSLAATAKIKEFNIQSTILFYSALLIEWFLFSNGFAPYWMYLTMIILVIIQNTLKLNLCHKYCSVPYIDYVKEVLLPLLSVTIITLLAGLIPYYIMKETVFRLIVSLLVTMITFCLFTYFIVLNSKEKSVITQIKNKIIDRYHNSKEKF